MPGRPPLDPNDHGPATCVTVKVSHATRRRVVAYAETSGVTPSEAFRRLVDRGLAIVEEKVPA